MFHCLDCGVLVYARVQIIDLCGPCSSKPENLHFHLEALAKQDLNLMLENQHINEEHMNVLMNTAPDDHFKKMFVEHKKACQKCNELKQVTK